MVAYIETTLQNKEIDILLPGHAPTLVSLGALSLGLMRGGSGLVCLTDRMRPGAGGPKPQHEQARLDIASFATPITLTSQESVRIGRIWGIQVFNTMGQEDRERSLTGEEMAFRSGLLTDPAISRTHLDITVLDGYLVSVRDLNSTTGTRVGIPESEDLGHPRQSIAPEPPI